MELGGIRKFKSKLRDFSGFCFVFRLLLPRYVCKCQHSIARAEVNDVLWSNRI